MNHLTIYREKQFFLSNFVFMESASFKLQDYSALKFGSDRAARLFGYKMADKFYAEYRDILINNRCVIIPSAFNIVKIASTILANHFMNKLNDLLTRNGYDIIEWTTMHRSMSYIEDYCSMSKEKRERLLKGDKLYINRDFVKNKVLLFVDDVTITGTHQDKIVNFLKDFGLRNKRIFCYCVKYDGFNPEIEQQLNSSGINTLDDYIKLVNEPGHHLVVRAIRFLLDQKPEILKVALQKLDNEFIDKLYLACIAKEYHKIDGYRKNFEMIRIRYDEIMRGNKI